MFQLLHARRYAAVRIDEPVNAEVTVVGLIAEVAAVGETVRTVIFANGNRVVEELPHAAAEETVLTLDHFPVIAQIARTVAH